MKRLHSPSRDTGFTGAEDRTQAPPAATDLAANVRDRLSRFANAASPLFSIVVPMFNRADTIERCLDSIRIQNFTRYEVVIVDDASIDDSVARCAGYLPDPRFRLIKCEVNRGVSPARNRGVDHAVAPWIIFLDSDDELLPGALARMAEAVEQTPETLHALWFRCRLDDGHMTPPIVPATTEWGYEGYLQFLEQTAHHARDMIRCVRRECFDVVRYPDSRMQMTKYHLDFALRFRSRMFTDVLRLYHQDAGERLITNVRALDRPGRDEALLSNRKKAFLRDSAEGFDALIHEHGEALRVWAPTMYRDYLRRAAITALGARRGRSARRHAFSLLRLRPASVGAWRIAIASLLVPERSSR